MESNKTYLICTKHFDEKDRSNADGTITLSKTAIPKYFADTENTE